MFRRTVSSGLVEAAVDAAALVGDSTVVFAAGKQLFLSRSSGPITSIARRGEGPCEIRGVVSLVSLSDSTFALVDVTNGRVQVRSFATCKTEITSDSYQLLSVHVSGDGLLARATGMAFSNVVLTRVDSGRVKPIMTLAASSGRTAGVCGYCWVEVLHDGTVYGTTLADTVYRILHYRRDGTFLRAVTREGVPLARLSESDRDSINDMFRGAIARLKDAESRRAAGLALRMRPRKEFRPLFFSGPIADQEHGHLLVSRSPESGKPLQVDIFELGSDRFIAEATLPAGTRLLKGTRKGVLAVRAIDDNAFEFTIYRARVK